MKKYENIANILKSRIEKNIKNGIIKLGTERELSEELGVSRQTIRTALSLLETENIINRRQGSGCYITGLLPGVLSDTISLVVNDAYEYVMPALISALDRAAHNAHFKLDTRVSGRRFDNERAILNELLSQKPRAVIVQCVCNSLPTPNADLFSQLNKEGIPVVFLMQAYPNLQKPYYVACDSPYGGRMAVSHLFSNGHKKIGGLFRSDDRDSIDKFSGYCEELSDRGLPFSDDTVLWYTRYDLNRLRKRNDTGFITDYVKKTIKSSLVSAVICDSDEIAYYLIKEAEYAHINIPGDVSVTGFDNSYLSSVLSTGITSFYSSYDELSFNLVSLCVRLSGGQRALPVILPMKESVRRSSVSPFSIPSESSPASF